MRRLVLLAWLLCLRLGLSAQTGYEYRYWFDYDESKVQSVTSPSPTWKQNLDISSLSDGLHTLYIAVKDAKGVMSVPHTYLFFKQPISSSMSYSYWFDDDNSSLTSGIPVGKASMLDVSALQDGFHQIHIQAGSDDLPSAVSTGMFIKVPQTEGVDYMTCYCLMDGKEYYSERVSSQGGLVYWTFDVNSLPAGLHRIQCFVVTPSGAASTIADNFFFRVATAEDLSTMKCYYSIDGSDTYVQAGTCSNGLFHFDLDVSSIADGLHRVSYFLASESGTSTQARMQFFMKTPVGGNGVVNYKYWINDDEAHAHSVTLDKRENPFSLIKLLPVDTKPIRSSCFQFAIKNGSPILYAKNDFHIQFIDVSNRLLDVTEQYVDEQVSQKLTGITALKETQTFARPAENGIKWFKFVAEEGDSIAFKTNIAASLQVFSPDGEEIYSASGSSSVTLGGCHTWDDGTYYLAVHDVTGSGSNLTLDYMHMDKYDVVGQDVYVVGNGGCSTITFQGNGFKDLGSVDLFNKEGNTIQHINIGHESDAATSVTFDFTDAEVGVYSALFHFSEEDKTFSNILNVEEAVNIELATNVSFPSVYVRGTTTTYTVKITNKGNMTAYRVPFYVYISTETEAEISKLKIEGLHLPTVYDIVNNDDLPEVERVELKQLSDSLQNSHYFISQKCEDELSGDSIWVHSAYLCTDISPNSEKTITFSMVSSEKLDCWFTVPDTWQEISTVSDTGFDSKLRTKGKDSDSWYCCYHERIECVVNGLATAAAVGGLIASADPEIASHAALTIADCLGNAASISVSWASDKFCGKGNDDGEQNAWDKIHSWMDGLSKAGVLTCWNPVGKITGAVQVAMHPVIVTDCFMAWSHKKPDCPPKPPKGGSSTPVNSLDPNEIYGYTSESGSKYMTDEVRRLNYRIQFENDTAFATASAHVVEVKDTLDSKYFDFSTYKPTSIKIGDKIEYLDGSPNFIKTIDMRPAIYAIAQVEGKWDSKKGIATWLFTSLDPMTMEPTDDVMQGFLPVNYDGASGVGEVGFEIDLKGKFAEGTNISNRASIVFDKNAPIQTPAWTNIIDATPPTSHVTNVSLKDANTFLIEWEGKDALSGAWKYDVYYTLEGRSDWICLKEGCDTTAIEKEAVGGLTYKFCVVATDSAGNVEQKELTPEFVFTTSEMLGDVNQDGSIDISDVVVLVNYILGTEQKVFNRSAADMNKDNNVDISDVVAIVNFILGG